MSAEGAPLIADARRQLESLPIAVILIDADCVIASANPAAEHLFGQSAKRLANQHLHASLRLLDRNIARLFADPDTPISARDIQVELSGRGQRRVDMTVAPISETPGWRLVTISDHGNFRDFGRRSGATSDRLRGPEILAHEIKNPLAGIRGAAQLLSRKVSSDDTKLTELITSEVDRIAKLIGQMQLLSGKSVAPVEPCNLHRLVHKAIAVIEMGEGPAGPETAIVEEFDPSLPEVLGNGDALTQVLINLLANAREACAGRPEPRITVSTRFVSGLIAHSARDNAPLPLPVELRVSDTGPGVAPDLRDTLFEPFATSKKDGQGLGLALVNKLVRDMNARITYDRDDETGLTHFRVFLPVARQAARR